MAAEARKREATFFLALFALGVGDYGIGADQLCLGILAVADVDHRNALADADLRRGQAHALRGVHGFEHVVHEFREFSRFIDWLGGVSSTGSPYFTMG